MEIQWTRSRLILLSLLVAAAVAIWLWLFPPRWWLNAVKPVDLTHPVATGMALIEKYECRRCHFIDQAGMSVAPTLKGVSRRLDSVSLRLWLRDPSSIKWNTTMPNFRLSDSEIEAIVAYLTELDRSGS